MMDEIDLTKSAWISVIGGVMLAFFSIDTLYNNLPYGIGKIHKMYNACVDLLDISTSSDNIASIYLSMENANVINSLPYIVITSCIGIVISFMGLIVLYLNKSMLIEDEKIFLNSIFNFIVGYFCVGWLKWLCITVILLSVMINGPQCEVQVIMMDYIQ